MYCVPLNVVLRIDPIPALTNLCSYARSVTPIATVPPLYPEPNVLSSKNSYATPPPWYVWGIVLAPAWTSNVLSETIPTRKRGLSWSWNIVVVTPTYPPPPIVLTASASAETNVWAYWSLAEEAPTLTLKVFVVTLLTVKYWFAAGSVALGFDLGVVLPSWVHVNTNDSVVRITASPFTNPWFEIVITKLPFAVL